MCDAPEAGGEPEYRSPFRSWDARATVRSAPRRELADDRAREGASLSYFLADLVPLARHKLVQELEPERHGEVLVRHLYRYLDFTTKLEHLVVNQTALRIAQGSVGLILPEEMRFDAYKVYCDEAYHALFSADLSRQVAHRTGIVPEPLGAPYFLRRLRQLQDADPGQAALMELLFVVVSETLITASLMELPDDPTLDPAVRRTLQDHAQDEGRHHTYFALFLKFLWAQLDRAERRAAALMVPDLIRAFLDPDLAAMVRELRGYGFSRDTARQIVAEVLPHDVIARSARESAAQTVRYFTGLGALDPPEVAGRFESRGLLWIGASEGGESP